MRSNHGANHDRPVSVQFGRRPELETLGAPIICSMQKTHLNADCSNSSWAENQALNKAPVNVWSFKGILAAGIRVDIAMDFIKEAKVVKVRVRGDQRLSQEFSFKVALESLERQFSAFKL